MRRHWRLILIIVAALAAAIILGVLAASCPPVLGFFVSLSIFGAAPFTGLGTMAVGLASLCVGGISASGVLIVATLIYTANEVGKLVDKWFRSHYPDHEIIDDNYEAIVEESYKNMNKDLGEGKKDNHGCWPCFSSKNSRNTAIHSTVKIKDSDPDLLLLYTPMRPLSSSSS